MCFVKRAVPSLWVPLSLYCAGLSLSIVTVGLFVLGLYVLTCITLQLVCLKLYRLVSLSVRWCIVRWHIHPLHIKSSPTSFPCTKQPFGDDTGDDIGDNVGDDIRDDRDDIGTIHLAGFHKASLEKNSIERVFTTALLKIT